MRYTLLDLSLYFLIYTFIGWVVEISYYSINLKKWVNRGLLNLPFMISYGLTALLTITLLGDVKNNYILQFLFILVSYRVVCGLIDFCVKGICGSTLIKSSHHQLLASKSWWMSCIISLIYLACYLTVHPFIAGFVYLLPNILKIITLIIGFSLLFIDFIGVLYTLKAEKSNFLSENHT